MTATFTTGAAPVAGSALATGELRIATLSRRSAAALLDSCIVFVIAGALLGVLWLIVGGGPATEVGYFHVAGEDSTPGQLLRAAGEALVVGVVWCVYAGALTSRQGPWNGRTVGKRAAQLRIVTSDGAPISPGTAWRRVLISTALLGLPGVAGTLVDAAAGTSPTASDAGGWIGAAVVAVTLLFALRGGLRQTAYDVLARTVVVDDIATPALAGAATGAAEVGGPAATFAQPTATPAPVVVSRRKTWWTWTGVAALVLCAFAAPLLGNLELPEDRSKEILAEPETKETLARIRTLETLASACLTSSAAEDCDEPSELGGAQGLEFSYDFDFTTDPVGAQAGKVAILPEDGDSLVIYGFTSEDRVWASTMDRGKEPEHVCIKHTSDDLCDGVYEW